MSQQAAPPSVNTAKCPLLRTANSTRKNAPLLIIETANAECLSYSYAAVHTAVTRLNEHWTAQRFQPMRACLWLPQRTSLALLCSSVALYRAGIAAAFLNNRLAPQTAAALQTVINPAAHLGEVPAALGVQATFTSQTLAAILSLTRAPPILKRLSENSRYKLQHAWQFISTAGTSGSPKLVAYSLADHLRAARRSNAALHYTSTSRWYLSLPCYHISGLGIWLRTLVAGASVYVPAEQHFNARAMLQAISAHAITHLSLIPTQLLALLAEKNAKPILKRCQVILLGGAPISEELWNLRTTLPLVMSYGMSETCAHIALHLPQQSAKYDYRPLRGQTVKVIAGEVVVGSRGLASGYLQASGLTPFPLHGNAFRTGDSGKLMANGALRLLGRRLNRITCGGETFQCESVETVLSTFFMKPFPPAKLSLLVCMVMGIADVKWGEVPIALLGVKSVSASAQAVKPSATSSALKPCTHKHLAALRTWLTQTNGHTPSSNLQAHLSLYLEPYKHPRAYYLLNPPWVKGQGYTLALGAFAGQNKVFTWTKLPRAALKAAFMAGAFRRVA